MHEALREAVGENEWERSDPDALWREDAKLRKALRPILADVGETAQFLATKRLALNNEGRDRFLDWLYEDLAEALRRLLRIADGDYSADKYAERFPSSMVLIPARHRSSYLRRGLLNGSQPAAALRVGVMSSPR